MIVKDLPKEAVFIQDSQEVDYILDQIGMKKTSAYGCLFVLLGDGEYKKVWGCSNSIPYLINYAYELK